MLRDRRAQLVLAALSAAAVLAGCGGTSGDSANPHSSTGANAQATASTTAATPKATQGSPPASTQGAAAPKGTSTHHVANPPAVPQPVPAGSSQPAPKLKGSDGSVERFGVEAPSQDATAIAQLVGDFESAMADGDATRLCELASSSITKQMVQLMQRARPGTHATCATVMAPLIRKPTAELAHAMRATKLLSIRVKGDRAFAMVRQPGVGAGPLAIVRENASWKVGSLAPMILSSPSTSGSNSASG